MSNSNDSQQFREELRHNLRAALKLRHSDTVSALRTLIAAIDNAEAVPPDSLVLRSTDGVIANATNGVGSAEAPRRDVAMDEVHAITRELADEYDTQAQYHRSIDQQAAADGCQRKAEVLRAYLHD